MDQIPNRGDKAPHRNRKRGPFLYLRVCLALLLLLSLAPFGCGKAEPQSSASTETLGSGVYRIYTCNQTQTALTYRLYQTDTTEAAVLVNELWRELRAIPDNYEQTSAIPEDVSISQTRMEGSILYLHFTEEYSKMTAIRELLCRAAIVRTMTQLENVTAVSFYLGDEPMKNRTGVSLGLMQGSDFIDHVNNDELVSSLQVVLYFAAPGGRSLVRESRTIPVTVAMSQEKALVSQLIAGPQENGHLPTLPAGLEVLSILTKDGICYISFDKSFTENTLDLLPEVVIYSLVNSLTELPAINQVQISVEGSASRIFKETVSLESPLERNLLIVTE